MAVLLTIGFYALAVGIAAGLLFAVYLELAYSSHILVKPTLLAIIAAAVILWSILPRFDRFVAPGPQLDERGQPRLFGILSEVAAATEQQMPREVYLVNDVNAWVAQRGGFAGIGSRRVMGIGLPLLQGVTVPQFRAIVAHEFGHYHGGDTALGPWIYKTRETIMRTVRNLAGGSLIHKPFLAYGEFFLEVTQSISRAQELAADVLAAKVAGARNAIDALVAVHRASAAFNAYWDTEVVPLLSSGYRPPITAGLSQFMSAGDIGRQLSEFVAKELNEGQANPYDSHPPLRERLDALEPLATGPAEDGPAATTLLHDVAELEAELIASLFTDPARAQSLRQIEWTETGTRVFLPMWRARADQHSAELQQIRVGALPEIAGAMPAFASRLRLRDVPAGEEAAVAESIVGCALAARLCDDGWSCDARPGVVVTLTKDERSIQPFAVMARLRKGELDGAAWAAQCEALGIGDLSLRALRVSA